MQAKCFGGRRAIALGGGEGGYDEARAGRY